MSARRGASRNAKSLVPPPARGAVRSALLRCEGHLLMRFFAPCVDSRENSTEHRSGRGDRLISVVDREARNRSVERQLELPAPAFDAMRLQAAFTQAHAGRPVDL